LILLLASVSLLLALGPCLLFCDNLRRFRPPAEETRSADEPAAAEETATTKRPEISVLIPARDEAEAIGKSVAAALASERVWVEVIVLDDASSDATPQIVEQLAADDPRVRLLAGKPLPPGWNGKQHACWQLAAAARFEHLLFLDADVRVQPDALWRLLRHQQTPGRDLLSAFPHQETGTLAEHLLIPMMHIILLSFLPLARMRASTHPAYAAGCGQCFLTDREAYRRAGTHAAIRATRHDGLQLPKAFRSSGQASDLVDGTPIATCRMYQSTHEVIQGLLKNAHEGIATPRLILPFTLFLLGGTWLPIVVLVAASVQGQTVPAVLAALALGLGWLPRWLAAVRFGQSSLGAALHPLAVGLFVALQWVALVRRQLGWTTAWRGRSD
jgi:hypothetical protein